MQQRTIGDRSVGAIGLGAMPLSIEGRPDEAQALATIRAALEAGITLIDTADAYHATPLDVGHNEILVAKALRLAGSLADGVVVATKGGLRRPGDGAWERHGRPEDLVHACEASLQRLDVETIDLYQLHRPDPEVPYEESVGALRDLLDAGKIAMAGISNADPGQIRLADEVLGGRLVSVQNQLSPSYRSSLPELRLCAEMGIAFLPWSPLGGRRRAHALASDFTAFDDVAAAHQVSPQRVCLAWLLAQAPVVIPIPGATRPETIVDSAAAADLVLTEAEVARLDR